MLTPFEGGVLEEQPHHLGSGSLAGRFELLRQLLAGLLQRPPFTEFFEVDRTVVVLPRPSETRFCAPF